MKKYHVFITGSLTQFMLNTVVREQGVCSKNLCMNNDGLFHEGFEQAS